MPISNYSFSSNKHKQAASEAVVANGMASWTDVLKMIHWPVTLSAPGNYDFNANLQRVQSGPLFLVIYFSDPIVARREGISSTSKNEQYFTLNYINKGSLVVEHNNLKTSLKRGDIILVNNALDSTIKFLNPSQAYSTRIPLKLLNTYIENPHLFCNQRIAASRPYNRLLKEIFLCLWNQGGNDAYGDTSRFLTNTLLSVFATALNTNNKKEISHSYKSEQLLQRIIEFINNNLSNSNLYPEFVASTFHISPRYLRKLFQTDGGNCMTDYIRKKRLEMCAIDLIKIGAEKKKITEIAYFWGFNNSSSFTRSFKSYFGISPTAYKNNKCC